MKHTNLHLVGIKTEDQKKMMRNESNYVQKIVIAKLKDFLQV